MGVAAEAENGTMSSICIHNPARVLMIYREARRGVPSGVKGCLDNE